MFASAEVSPAQEGVCSLADHIRSANTNSAVGFCQAGTSHDIITIADDITLSEPLPPIRGTITIEGGGHTISGDKKFRIFDVVGGTLTLKTLTLTKGNALGEQGGALRLRGGGRVTVNDVVFAENEAKYGGAIQTTSASANLTVNNSAFYRNRAINFGTGGAIAVDGGKVNIASSSFVGNRSDYLGGAISSVWGWGEITVLNSTFSHNLAEQGGAFHTDDDSVTLSHVTMINNRSYINRRSKNPQGHAIYIAPNNPRRFRLRNSIIYSEFINGRQCAGNALQENRGNLFATYPNLDVSCGTPTISADPMLADLTGSPAYYPLLHGSPALDTAIHELCPGTDQIGTLRPKGGGCDIGAIESATAIPAPRPVATLCILPDQIIAANTDKAYKACPAGNGADTIYMIRDFELDQPLPAITSEITIEGNSYTINARRRFHIFDIDGGNLTLKDVTLTEGDAINGGAIRLRNGATASVSNVNFKGNRATAGGAISTESEDDRLSVTRSSFVDNSAEHNGGAILVDGGHTSVDSSAFQNNVAAEHGGAIFATGGRAALNNSTFIGNRAKRGGAFYLSGGTATLTHLTMMGNRAERIVGAGIYTESGETYLLNSIIAGSEYGNDCSGRLAESRGNFSQDGTCSQAEGGDPMLGELAGWPAHYPLLDASPAHGTADPAFCLPTDQLGNARTHCDIGAIESARDPNYSAVPKVGLPPDCTLQNQIIAANKDEPAGGCPAGEGADLIVLRKDITLSQSLPVIASDITINGNGHTISGSSSTPIFAIESGAVVIKNLSLRNGSNMAGYGGAITLRNSGTLTVANVTFRNNSARYGGAIAAIDSSALSVFESIFLNNTAELSGGAVWNDGACGNIDNNEFRGNSAGAPARSEPVSEVRTVEHLDGHARVCASFMANTFYDS